MYQKLVIAGNLGSDPQMRYMQDGTAVTNFSVATNRRWTNRATGESQEEVTWFRVSVWGKQAEACNQYLSKGRPVLVEGRLQSENGSPRLWTAQDGTVRASFEITAELVRFMGSKDNGGVSEGQTESWGEQEEEEDDIPF